MEIHREQILGKGGFGTVYMGSWNRMPVAIKRIQLVHLDSSEKEEEALRNLKHPNVIQIYQAENDDDFRYFALELCEASLDKLFRKDGDPKKCRRRMPPREDVLYQLATGLEYIHKMEMTHRDIKPQNVLIWVDSKDGLVIMKWADFGLSKKVNERGTFSMSAIKGTDNWLAPELLKLLKEEEELTEGSEGSTSPPRQRGTVKSDVYAEGLVFGYFYLDGEHIFGNINSQTLTISNNIMKNNPVNISKIQPTHVHDLIQKMLASVPERRITSSDVVKLLAEYRTQVVLPGSMLEIDSEKIFEKSGYGILFEGVWGTTRLPVAVKRMQLIHVLGKKQEESWLSLSHVNVVKLFHAESDSKFRYYALELCQASMDQIFLKDGDPKKYRGPKPQAEEALYQLANGLEYIHKTKLIHCDLKPKNVLLLTGNSSSVVMKWTNFGLSKQVDENGTCLINEIKGNEWLAWLAPEILQMLENEEINQSENQATLLWEYNTFKSDVFAEGLVFGYFLLEGLHPFGSIVHKIPANIDKNDAVNLNKIEPSPLSDLTLKMLAHHPEDRMTSSDVIEELNVIRKLRFKEMEKTLFALCTKPTPNLKKMENLVNQGISVNNCFNQQGLTPLLQLLANGEAYHRENFVDIIRYFVAKEIHLNVKNAYGENALLKLIVQYPKDDLIDIVKLFIDNGIDINCKNKYGTNILHYLCEYYLHDNLIDIIRLLIEQKVEINCSHDYGYNALPVLCRNYNKDNLFDVVKLLIDNGIEVHCNPNNDGNALNIVCRYYKKDNMIDIIQLLSSKKGGELNGSSLPNGSSTKATKRSHD
ncbi:hypothetical protein DAPPUDRAFT_101008 [Daphnia pulex]|uniref:Protein kinase domain-containing protein n=1 Tax=Daphnia pulex TaxID=6669 RepID=E9GBY3_DAPPU|nr:hypothetical protein DAPPUDRAFT_101008 [Daphnia pulex]|eukprot:EFX83036.1 hypothetical protein DAPPUDRAFT_101008 [Daphnia pulex]